MAYRLRSSLERKSKGLQRKVRLRGGRTNNPSEHCASVGRHATALPRRAVLATERPLPERRVDAALERGDRRTGVHCRLDVAAIDDEQAQYTDFIEAESNITHVA